MTQSGQGEQPSAGPVREGVVLPSDGGGPLPPGRTGPAGGPAWDRSWGPEQQQGQAAPAAPGQGWQAPPAQPWDHPGPLPAGSAQPPAYGTQAPPPAPGPAYGAAGPSYGAPGPSYGAAGQAQGATGPSYGAPGSAYGAPGPSYGAAGQAQGATGPSYGAPGSAYGAPGPAYGAPGQAQGAVGQPYGPPAPGYGASGEVYGGPASAPPPPADEGATQYLPPVRSADAAPQYPWPAAPPADDGATQYIPPVPSGALPPERPAGPPSEETRFLGRVPHGSQPGAAAGPVPPASGPDAEATQYIAPVPAGAPYGAAPGGGADRQPPAEFDNLFRDASGGDGSAGSTQQLPLVEEPPPPYAAAPAAYAPQGPGGYPPRGPGGHGGGRGGRGGRAGSRVPLLAAVGVGLAVVGVGAGALLAGGDGDGDDGKQPVSATAPVTAASSAPPAVDPARQQAVELDKLLADSGSSRAAVIEAVADVRSCDNLAQAATSLRDAAEQRSGLVTRLRELAVDRLPNHATLTEELTKAWQASASADSHYAAWADQVAGKNGCKKGRARTTGHTQAGNRASGTANTHKEEAARLWNEIAQEMGLTRRQASQL